MAGGRDEQTKHIQYSQEQKQPNSYYVDLTRMPLYKVQKGKEISVGFHTTNIPVRTSTTIKTITSCLPEVTNRPLSCPPGGCHVDPPSPITTWKHRSTPSSEPDGRYEL
ncbi:hypothetical protein J3E69DRAFT_375623 [Trichoderma sp. SZMC 28015]